MRRFCSAAVLLLLSALGLAAQTAPHRPAASPASPAASQGGKTDPVLAAVRAYRQANGARILGEFSQLLALPNVASDLTAPASFAFASAAL